MIFIYGRANGSCHEAKRLYQERFPDRQQPDRKTFAAVFRRLAETGSLLPNVDGKGKQREIRTPELEENVLQRVGEEPNVSTRQLGKTLRVGHATVWRILKEQLLHPYHLQRVQALGPADFPARLAFCNWFLQKHIRSPAFVSSVIFTDEATFSRDGIVNLHNQHVWSDENPRDVFQGRHQQQFKINIWVGITGDCLLGPHILPPTLNGIVYRNFLINYFPTILEDVPLETRQNTYFMHDGAPAHYTLQVREYLNDVFGQKWIGRGGPVAWPPRSPDLNPIDFYIWGHMKSLVYSTPVETQEMLHQRIQDAAATIRNQPGIFERVRQSFVRRVNACIASNGSHFEHLI